MIKYFFVLGNNPSLSIAEILAIFPNYITCSIINREIFILELLEEIDSNILIKKLGGTIKIGVVNCEVKKFNKNDILTNIQKIIRPGEGKFKFGISYYGQFKLNIKVLGMEIKKFLKKKEISCRWVVSREKTLSSVVVEQNKLTKKGIEIVIIEHQNNLFIGYTEAVQDFKSLSFRDYNRPARDSHSGMLPPKLAQIMINIAKSRIDNPVLLDPFCGSGTILMEAMLMGIHNVVGSDISEKAVIDTRKNTEWVQDKFNVTDFKYEVYHKSATELSRVIDDNTIDVIATEPYLGPQRGRLEIPKIKKELEILYAKSISEFKKVLKNKGRVVMLWPCFTNDLRSKNPKLIHINPNYDGFKIVSPIAEILKTNSVIRMSHRHTIVYGREGQRVWREVVVLEKN